MYSFNDYCINKTEEDCGKKFLYAFSSSYPSFPSDAILYFCFLFDAFIFILVYLKRKVINNVSIHVSTRKAFDEGGLATNMNLDIKLRITCANNYSNILADIFQQANKPLPAYQAAGKIGRQNEHNEHEWTGLTSYQVSFLNVTGVSLFKR